jgi:predicted double-glycine peptidase
MKTLRRYLVCLLVLQALGVGASVAEDQSPVLRNEARTAPKTRHTLKQLRDRNVVKQETDFSCGAATLATLLTYYYGDKTSEYEILKLLESKLTPEEKASKLGRALSLADLKQAAEMKGYRAAGFRISVDQLSKLAAPVIVFIQPMGYNHFAVFRGISQGRVFLADPARGNLRMSMGRFLDEWGGIVFVLGKEGEENIKDYPLKPPESFEWPELVRVSAMSEVRNIPIGRR